MTIDETNLLTEKAKKRKNGVYSFRSYFWVVKNNRFIAFSDYHGNCYIRMGAFNAILGKVDTYNRKQELLKWLKTQS